MASIIQTNVGELPLVGNVLSGDIESLENAVSEISANAILKNVDTLEISGGIEISGDSRTYGNFVQTTPGSDPGIYGNGNAFVHASDVEYYGNSYSGTRGFCIIGVDLENNGFYLSGDIS